ncbi:hypothetical protein LEMLEM_LOCUS9893 [Lemmus lemmus]
MLSCGFRVHEGSDLKNEKIRGHGGGHGGAQRSQVHSWVQCLWPLGRKETRSQGSQDQDQADQVTTLKCPLSQDSLLILAVLRIMKTWNDNNQNIGVLCLFESSSLISPHVEKESSPKEPVPTVLKKTDPEERKEFVPNDLEDSGPKDAKECGPKEPKKFCLNTMDVLVDNMLTAVQDGDRNSLIAFLCISPMCDTIQQVLHVLFMWIDSSEVFEKSSGTSSIHVSRRVRMMLVERDRQNSQWSGLSFSTPR